MFGESESESPRVPSPWDSLISTPPSPSPTNRSQATPSPLAIEIIPRLVPEADDGNVEYKLQLLSPSPARFARLVTQLKWRLLEGGGQAYYELGVADSGALVGLPRAELEQSLETLEMMAGEIGASVIVVKEIEVPAVMAGIAATQTDKWNGKRKKRAEMPGSEESESSTTVPTWSTTETETEQSTDFDDNLEDMSMTVVLNKNTEIALSLTPSNSIGNTSVSSGSSVSLFSMDPDPDPADNADAEPDEDPALSTPYFSIDLEISSVFKPRPMRARMQTHTHTLIEPVKTKRLKKIKHITHPHINDASDHQQDRQWDHGQREDHKEEHNTGKYHSKSNNRRQIRDRKRADKRNALLAFATGSIHHPNESPASLPARSPSPDPTTKDDTLEFTSIETSALVSGLASLHVSLDDPAHSMMRTSTSPKHLVPTIQFTPDIDEKDTEDNDEDDDVFASPTVATPFTTFQAHTKSSANLSAPSIVPTSEDSSQDNSQVQGQSRLIVEALVVRKMSLDEAFLDFGGFALM